MKELYNFYIEPKQKKEITEKLDRLCGNTTKGKLSALIRVLLAQFNATPDEKVNKLLIEAIEAEYIMCAKKNKRSRM